MKFFIKIPKSILRVLVAWSLLLAAFLFMAHLYRTISLLEQRLATTNEQIAFVLEAATSTQEALFSEKIDSLVAGAASDKERALRIAGWIATSFTNSDSIAGDFQSFALRAGLCRNRADIFVKAMDRLLIPAKIFNMYNFPTAGSGHSAAIAWFDGKWHYFDMMYGGYFVHNGDMLSWEEIVDAPEAALSGIVTFPYTLDKWSKKDNDIVYPAAFGGPNTQLQPISNLDRMRHYYTEKSIAKAKESSGPLGPGCMKNLIVTISKGQLPLHIGSIDNSYQDVEKYGSLHELTEYLGFALSTHVDFFSLRWHLDKLVPGEKYLLRFHLYGKKLFSHFARIVGGEILEGASFDFKSGSREWTILFQAKHPEVTLTFSHAGQQAYTGPFIDAITLKTVDEIQ